MKKFQRALLGASFLALSYTMPAQAAADPALLAARTHFFGIQNVDPKSGEVDKEKVIIAWFSVQSYAVAARGHVFLLDSYIYRISDTEGYVPTTL